MGRIEFENIHKSFGANTVLQGVDLQVDAGSVHYIIGQSGAGKSVLVKHLIGLERPDRGRVFLDGQDVTELSERALYPLRKRCAMVFQHATLFDSMTLLNNVALPLRKHRDVDEAGARELAHEELKRVEMDEYADRYPADFGDGMRKKVAIARALTLEPEFVIFDEPTTGLDPLSADMVDELIRDLSDDLGVTSIVISHDLRSTFRVADRIAMLYKGKLRLKGTPETFRQTDDPVVRQFIDGSSDGPMEEPGGEPPETHG
jgi:phospholipid/cholesterol/gamma-HCH transport system ATP-binding protein